MDVGGHHDASTTIANIGGFVPCWACCGSWDLQLSSTSAVLIFFSREPVEHLQIPGELVLRGQASRSVPA